jgi:hypothetical protein
MKVLTHSLGLLGIAGVAAYIYKERINMEEYSLVYSRNVARTPQSILWAEESGVGNAFDRYTKEKKFQTSGELERWLSKKIEEVDFQVKRIVKKYRGDLLYKN